MKLAAFLAIFAQPWFTFVHRGKNFNTGYQTVVCGITDFDCGEPHFNIQ
jgi:hypothetical protein